MEITDWLPEDEAKKEEEEKQSREQIKQEQKEAIVKFIEEKGITFPTEIRRNLGMSKDRVYDLLWELVQEGKIKRHPVPEDPCKCFRRRMVEFWNMGIKGKGAFKRVTWFVPATCECPAL